MVISCMVISCMVISCMINGNAWSRIQAVTRSWNEAGEGGERKKVGKLLLRHSEKLFGGTVECCGSCIPFKLAA